MKLYFHLKTSTMKKFMIIFAACCLIFTSCNNKTKEPVATETQQAMQKISEKQKQVMEDWDNWDNLTEERKTELLNLRKDSYDKIQEDQEIRAALKEKFEKQMENWDNLTMEEKKNAFDLCNPKTKAAQAFIKQYKDSISRQEK